MASGVFLFSAAVASLALAADALHGLELSTVDARFSLRGARAARPGIVIVGLDARTLERLGLRPPLPRSIHARLIEMLRRAQPKLIADDFQFIGRSAPRQDAALIDAVSAARPVLLGTHDSADGTLPFAGRASAARRTRARLGTVAVLNDSDGKIRRMMYAPVRLESFDVLAAEMASAHAVSRSSFPQNSAWIDFAGPPGTFPTYSFGDVLAGRVPRSAFAGKLVLVGATDPLEKDVFQTPISDREMSGVELHANSIATILGGFSLKPVSPAVDYAVIVLLSAFATLLVLSLPVSAGVGACGAIMLAYAIASQLAFDDGHIVSVSYPALGLMLAAAGTLTLRVAAERSERAHLRALFARFVPMQIVDQVISRTDDDLRLGAMRGDGTVLFVDLRGFTTFAEVEDVSRVLDLINRYFTEISEAIFEHGGTLLSYNGDGVVAMFGAPVPSEDHADRAVAAGKEIVAVRMPRVNEWLRERGADPLAVGVGINSGEVLSGNVGSQTRLEYTAVGDVPNLASRLESMTKDSGHQLFLSAETHKRLLRPRDDLHYVGEFEVRGRASKVGVWTVADAGPSGSRRVR